MNLSSLSSFATAAFDTTRSTFKAMAEAAVPPADNDGSAPASASGGGDRQGAAARSATVRPAEANGAGRADAEEQKPSAKGRRRGTVLDAYA